MQNVVVPNESDRNEGPQPVDDGEGRSQSPAPSGTPKPAGTSSPTLPPPRPAELPSDIGEAPVGRVWIILLALMLVCVAGLTVVALVQMWPASNTAGTLITHHVVIAIRANLNLDTNLLLIVLLSGALGGLLHAIRSIAWYVGERQLRWSWVLFYVSLPFVGAILSLIVYLLIRGGLISTQGTTKDLSPYGIAAISSLVGLFSIQAVEMLKKVFSTIFASAPSGSDTAPQSTAEEPRPQ